MSERVAIVGGGLAGPLMALYLGRAGYDVRLHERRGDPRRREAGPGRSINLAISVRGLHALAGVGLEKEVLAVAVPMRGRMVHAVDGDLAFQPYGTEAGQVIHSVSRVGLNAALLDAAERDPRVSVQFHQRCSDVDLDAPALELEDERTGERLAAAPADVVIGADGAFSAVRSRMQKLDRFEYQQSYLEHGYKELTIPPRPDGGFPLEKHALHIWPRGGFMMIALPNLDGSFTCTLFWPFEGPASFKALGTPEDVRRFFEHTFPDAVPLMPTLLEDFFENPTGSLVTVRCRPWHHRRVALLGDAAHAIVPFYGQGANAAFEDCVVLDASVRRHAPDWSAVFSEYERQRRENTDALAELAIENFLEMRDRVGTRRFRAKKKLEHALHRGFPAWFVPLYTMVSFTRTPYAVARRRALRQWRVVGIALSVLLALLLVLAALPVWL